MKGKADEGKDNSSRAADQRTMKGCLQHIIKELRRGRAIFGVHMRWGDLSKVGRGKPSALAKVVQIS